MTDPIAARGAQPGTEADCGVATEVLRQIDLHWPDLFKAHPVVAVIRRMVEDAALAEAHRQGRDSDLRTAIEIMATKVTPYGEREDGTTSAYIVADSTWHRVLAIARGSASDATLAAIEAHWVERLLAAVRVVDERVAAALRAGGRPEQADTLLSSVADRGRREYAEALVAALAAGADHD